MSNIPSDNTKLIPHTYVKETIYSDNIKKISAICVLASIIAVIAAAIFLSETFVLIGLTALGVTTVAVMFSRCSVNVRKTTETRDGSNDEVKIVVEKPKRSPSQLLQDAKQEAEGRSLTSVDIQNDSVESKDKEKITDGSEKKASEAATQALANVGVSTFGPVEKPKERRRAFLLW